MSAKDYPVTFPYGATTPPYSFTHPHRGDDRKMPLGTDIVVNGVLVGHAGNTGKSTGVHTHTQKVVKDRVENPRGKGFDVPQPTIVVAVGFNSEIGNFIRYRDGDGVTWSIFHMQHPALVNVGQELKRQEEEEMPEPIFNEGDRLNVNYHLYGKDMGYHKDQINRTYKQAREYIDSSPEFKAEHFFNAGDAVNTNNALGRTDANGQVGKLHKSVIYGYFFKIQSPGGTVLKPGRYFVN